ncbi:MAG TPA: choice-of-anchor D domain-containing protein, partial [Cyclobacteriaceae bacterium]
MRLFLLTLLSVVVFNVSAQSPQVTLNKSSISTSVDLGSTTTQTFTVKNTGTSTLFWNLNTRGAEVDFAKAAYANWTLPANQDRISDNVKITRKDNQAIFNIASESAYASTSPANTLWVYGKSEDHTPGDYVTWATAVNNNPQGMVGNVISMHSILDDRYFDVTFDSYAGANTGGGFSYSRIERNVPWMEADVTSGSLPPGQSKEITLTLSTTSLAGGLNSGYVIIESNDPNFSEKSLAINLTVESPEIDAATSVALGQGYVGLSSVLPNTVYIENTGDGVLTITNIQSSTSVFEPQTTAINILPGESYDLAVKFTPTTLGANTGNLTITSNDEDEQNFVVAVSANALAAASAPVLSVNATTFSQNLQSEETASQDLVISNNGVGPLEYTIEFSLGKSAPVTFTKTNYADPMLPENQDRISPSILITRADQAGLFNAKVESSFSSGTSPANTLWTNTSTAVARETGATYTNWRNAMNSNPPSYVNMVTSMYLPDENRFFDIVTKQWTRSEEGGGFSYERTEIYNWVTSGTTSGTINAAEAATIPLDFNASMLPAGTYHGLITIKSNDPATPVKEIAVTLIISGKPVASIHEGSVSFDNTVVGLVSTKKVRVINDGAEPLTISAIAFDDAEVQSAQSNLIVAPFSVGLLELTFTPTAEAYAGNATLTTNDIDNPTLTFSYTGNGLAPGDINLVLENMNATVATGNNVTKTITIENTGTGTVNWAATLVNNNPVVTFKKEDYADSKLAQNQDRISPKVWLTRGDIMGLYNAALESGYDRDNETSPAGTAWQEGSSFEASLNNYSNWKDAVYPPTSSVDKTYSLHAANEYYDVTFRSWTSDDGGGFSYERKKAAGWIKLDNYSGSMASGGSSSITVTYDPSD